MTAPGGRVLLGVLTPSSNTRLEPLTSRMLEGLGEVSAHFSRFRVVDVSIHPDALSQFDVAPILAASELLADARVDTIVWSGTSGGWKGLDADRELCARITEHTGCLATTCTLALIDALALAGAPTLGLVTPYPDDMHQAIIDNLAVEGVTVVTSRQHAVTESNWALSEIGVDVLGSMTKEVASDGPAVVCIFCTNLAAADQVPAWESALGVPIYDSVSLAVWSGLRLAGVDPGRVVGWGSLFQLR